MDSSIDGKAPPMFCDALEQNWDSYEGLLDSALMRLAL
jgi:hypothetical protein